MSTTTTAAATTATVAAAAMLRTASESEVRRRRRASTNGRRKSCSSLGTLEALDLTAASPALALAAIRTHVLAALADVEARLSLLDGPAEPALAELRACGEHTLEDARAWAEEGLALLRRVRRECEATLPALHMEDLSMDAVRAHLPDLHDVRAHLPDMPAVRAHLPEMPGVRAHLPDIPDLADVRERLAIRLGTLQAHLTRMRSVEAADLAPSALLSDLLERLSATDLAHVLTTEAREDDGPLERAAKELARAMQRSMHGAKLIAYHDLPQAWRNNSYVKSGYRFIPLEKWPLIILSLFAWHNETLNIHTHLIPFLLWSYNSLPFLNTTAGSWDIAQRVFVAFALLCLLCSTVWHTMAGCAHYQGMELSARVDYIGIGWLISASVASVVYYGFQEHENLQNMFLVVCLCMGISGSVLPFMSWFNDPKYRLYRIAFFVTLALSSIAPLASLSYLYSTQRTLSFIAPIVPSLRSYCIGLVFYATHFPECFLAARWAHWLDLLGGGSHAIWHVWIVLAISQHWHGMGELRHGILATA